MNAKKIAGFVLCKSAFTQRNMTSIGLVAAFFVVYVLAGGRVTTSLPELRNAGGLGPSNLSDSTDKKTEDPLLTTEESQTVLGIRESEERAKRDNSQNNRYKLFTEEETKELENKPVDSKMLVKGATFGPSRREQLKLERQEKKDVDMLRDIEDRLKKRSMQNY